MGLYNFNLFLLFVCFGFGFCFVGFVVDFVFVFCLFFGDDCYGFFV